MGLLSDKSVVLTGASRGIGAAAAEAMAAEGAALLLLARSGEGITSLASRLRKTGAKAEAMTCDVAAWSQVEAAIAHARDLFGRIDMLVNNAGVIEPIGPLSRADPAAWGRAADINFKGVFHGMRAVLPGMRAQGSGVIVNLGSGAAHNPLEGWSHYCAAKAATAMLTRCAHLENRGKGHPGLLAVARHRRHRHAAGDQGERHQPGQPDGLRRPRPRRAPGARPRLAGDRGRRALRRAGDQPPRPRDARAHRPRLSGSLA